MDSDNSDKSSEETDNGKKHFENLCRPASPTHAPFDGVILHERGIGKRGGRRVPPTIPIHVWRFFIVGYIAMACFFTCNYLLKIS